MEQAMSQIIAGGVITILDKFIEPLFKVMGAGLKKKWDEFRVDFDLAFKVYLKNSYAKYSRIKTVLYRIEPKYIYDFFEIPLLMKENRRFIYADGVKKITDISNFILIQGSGGIGKSTLLKHLFISELNMHDLIPIFIELKDINESDEKYEIEDFIFERLTNLGSKAMDMDCFHYALQSGCFLFLMDGYDEVMTDRKNIFLRKFDAFCDRYSTNHFILTSRPCSDFIELQRYTVLSTCPLNKKQAISLINKADFDEEIKGRFIRELDSKLYDEHESFASNPLLLNIMLLTFDNYAEIPEKLHLFYSNAFETMYSKHDATKAGYRRELQCKLPYDAFKIVFSYFCYITYLQGKLEFTREELLCVLKKIKIITFDSELYINDLVSAVCVLYQDGLKYKFSHRSFQEYFTALFLKELTDENMGKCGLRVIESDTTRASRDEVFPMLCDMAEEKFERNILLPLIEDFEHNHEGENLFYLYFTSIADEICFSDIDERHDVLIMSSSFKHNNNPARFIERFYNCYSIKATNKKEEQDAEKELLLFLKDNRDLGVENRISVVDVLGDNEVRDLVKKTWIGRIINSLVNAKEILKEKLKKHEMDLLDFVSLIPEKT